MSITSSLKYLPPNLLSISSFLNHFPPRIFCISSFLTLRDKTKSVKIIKKLAKVIHQIGGMIEEGPKKYRQCRADMLVEHIVESPVIINQKH